VRRVFFWAAFVAVCAVTPMTFVRRREMPAIEPEPAAPLPDEPPDIEVIAAPETVAAVTPEPPTTTPEARSARIPEPVRTSRGVAFAVGAAGGLILGATAMALYMGVGPGQHTARAHAATTTVLEKPVVAPAHITPSPAYASRDLDVTILAQSGTAVMGTIQAGAPVDVFVIDKGWAAVRYPAGTSGWGWAPASALYWPPGEVGIEAVAPAVPVDAGAQVAVAAPIRAPRGSDDVAWMAALVALGLTLLPAGLAWRLRI